MGMKSSFDVFLTVLSKLLIHLNNAEGHKQLWLTSLSIVLEKSARKSNSSKNAG